MSTYLGSLILGPSNRTPSLRISNVRLDNLIAEAEARPCRCNDCTLCQLREALHDLRDVRHQIAVMEVIAHQLAVLGARGTNGCTGTSKPT